MCASEAIITSRMGVVTDAQKRPLDYNSETNDHTMKNGIIASRNLKIYQLCMKRLEKKGTFVSQINQEILDEIERKRLAEALKEEEAQVLNYDQESYL